MDICKPNCICPRPSVETCNSQPAIIRAAWNTTWPPANRPRFFEADCVSARFCVPCRQIVITSHVCNRGWCCIDLNTRLGGGDIEISLSMLHSEAWGKRQKVITSHVCGWAERYVQSRVELCISSRAGEPRRVKTWCARHRRRVFFGVFRKEKKLSQSNHRQNRRVSSRSYTRK